MAKDRLKIQLPKDAVGKINLGQSFAEYDRLLARPEVFVVTPAIQAALDSSRSKCFFVGRRGTGKTAITYYLSSKNSTAINLHPQLFTSLTELIGKLDISDSRQRPVQSLVAAFRRSLVDEVISAAIESHQVDWDDLHQPLPTERNMILDHDFDTRTISFIEEALGELKNRSEKQWLRFMRKSKEVAQAYLKSDIQREFIVLIDRLDETWDGSSNAVILLLALMHACVELAATIPAIRLMLFLRENIFERIRDLDKEFTRLETCVVSLDWTEDHLQELIERRLQLGLNPKPKVGETWDLFFERSMGSSSIDMVLDYCQHRPRDVITYCTYAVESAQSQRHNRVLIEDLQSARKRFSESRLKDLGDEYSENYPRIELVLNRFHGLAKELIVLAVEGFIKKLLVDDEVKTLCASCFSNAQRHISS
jgi:Cdc6-like AAA superfamily ATPase